MVMDHPGTDASPSDNPGQSNTMPLPPMQYVMNYTDEAVRRGSAPLPPRPISDSYIMFGKPFSVEDCIVPSLESQGIRRLYSTKEIDRPKELRKLNHSILVNFLDLIEILIKNPDSAKREEKIEDLSLMFIHMHHLINEFRPIHARELLQVMLYAQKRGRLQVVRRFRDHLDKVQEMIELALDALPSYDDDNLPPRREVQSRVNEDSQSTNDGMSSAVLDPFDKELCLLADEEAPNTFII